MESKDHIRDLLWLVPRRYDSIDGADYVEVIERIDSLKESCDEIDGYVTYTEEIPVFIRYYMESYTAPDGVNAIDHKDVILLLEGEDMAVCIQSPDKEDEWKFYLVADYGDWLLKEVELRYRISFPELFSETADSEQEENEAVGITDPQKAEATGFLILHYNNGTVYATQSNRLYFSYIPYGNLLLNAEGNMGLYTDDVYSIVDGQVTLIATGYRGLWAMQDGEIVALLDESYLKEIPAAKG